MSILKLKYTLPILLITVAAIGGVKLFYRFVEQQMEAEQYAASVSSSSSDVQAADVTTEKLGKPTGISFITRRNLFASRDKAPAVTEKKPQVEIRPSSLAVVLMGTITGSDGVERAIIYEKKERKQELYQVGDYLQQAAIKQIMRGKVIITLNGRDEILDIAAARDVKVPQYKKPGPPVTTSQRVQGRAVGNAAGQPSTANGPEGLKVVVPTPQNTNKINSNKSGLIIKGRAASEQNEQAN